MADLYWQLWDLVQFRWVVYVLRYCQQSWARVNITLRPSQRPRNDIFGPVAIGVVNRFFLRFFRLVNILDFADSLVGDVVV